MRRLVLLGAACAALACIPKPQPVKARAPMSIAAALVNDQEEGNGVEPLPEGASGPLARALADRNLRARFVGRETIDVAFRARRTTAHRLALLAEAATEADLLLLVETRTRFYSALNGRYRWTVDARLSMAKRDARDEATTIEVDVPVFLDFDHQKEAEALAAAGPRLADELGRLADDFLSGLSGLSAVPGVKVAGPVPAKPRPTPESIYFVLVDRFANGDPSNDGTIDLADPQAFHGGDLQGVLDRLDHIQSLGFTTVWLSPVFAMRTEKFHGYGAYHGYWTTDFGKVEPRFGDEALLKKLSDELHRRGMKLVLDVVLNHVGPDAPLTKERPEWFHGKGAITDWNDPEQLQTRDIFGLPDLAQEREDVYQFLLGHSKRWIDAVAPDGFRLDAARHVPVSFWARYNKDIRAHRPGFKLYGEMYDGDAEGLSRILREARFDAVFDFPLYFALTDVFCKDRSPVRLASTLGQDRLYADPSRLVTFLDNHDLPRALSACGGDTDAVAQALQFQVLARGIPSLTYGTESGLLGEKEPENRADMTFGPVDGPIANAIRFALALRRDYPVFVDGVSRPVSLDETHFAYARVSRDGAALIAVNRDHAARTIALPPDLAGPARDAYSGEAVGTDSITVPARSTRVALLSPAHGTKPALAAAGLRVVPVGFAIRGAELGKGEDLVLVGSAPEMGSWSPAKGKVLRRRADGAFVGELLLPTGAYEWKLVVRGKGQVLRWEHGENRPLLVDRGRELELAWREAPPRVGATP